VAVSYKKLYAWFRRLGVLRPMAEKADVQAQEAWKKGAIGSLAGGGAKARGRGGVCRRNAAGPTPTGTASMEEAGGEVEMACRTEV
jgi:hypothetical protein